MVSLQRIAIPLFYNSDKDKEFSFNFRQRSEALINTDTKRFKIQTSDMGAPPGRASFVGCQFFPCFQFEKKVSYCFFSNNDIQFPLIFDKSGYFISTWNSRKSQVIFFNEEVLPPVMVKFHLRGFSLTV